MHILSSFLVLNEQYWFEHLLFFCVCFDFIWYQFLWNIESARVHNLDLFNGSQREMETLKQQRTIQIKKQFTWYYSILRVIYFLWQEWVFYAQISEQSDRSKHERKKQGCNLICFGSVWKLNAILIIRCYPHSSPQIKHQIMHPSNQCSFCRCIIKQCFDSFERHKIQFRCIRRRWYYIWNHDWSIYKCQSHRNTTNQLLLNRKIQQSIHHFIFSANWNILNCHW